MMKLNREIDCKVCARCMVACPKEAIQFKKGRFNYFPQVNSSCIQCGACERACNSRIRENRSKVEEFYVGYSKEQKIVEKSSSGGIFSQLAAYILKKNGIVFGASFDEMTRTIKHIGVTNYKDLSKLRKSKYVQSNWSDIISEVDKAINADRYILFTGTPCQVSTIYEKYYNYEKLFCMDLFCHGVINAQLLIDYIDLFQTKITSVDFRTPSDYNNFSLALYSGEELVLKEDCEENIFYKLFITSAGIKKSCFECEYSTKKHLSDITVGDFDNISYCREHNILCKTPSIIAINTEKGKLFLEEIIENLHIEKIEDKKVISSYYRNHTSEMGLWGYDEKYRKNFCHNYLKDGFLISCIETMYPEEYALIIELEKYSDIKIFLYGAGMRGSIIYRCIRLLRPKWIVEGYVVTKRTELTTKDGLKIYEIDEIDCEDKNNIFVVSVYGNLKEQIVSELKNRNAKMILE